jgi:hypothetical protein
MPLLGQHEEDRLKGVLRVLVVGKGPAAHAEHHGAVPPDDLRERLMVVVLHEPVHQLRIGDGGGHLRGEGNLESRQHVDHVPSLRLGRVLPN